MANDKLERLAKAIMRKMKGWSAKEMREDLRDYPEAFQAELIWLCRTLRRVPEALVLDELKKSGARRDRA